MVSSQPFNSDEIGNKKWTQKETQTTGRIITFGKLFELSDKLGEQVVRLQNLRNCLKSISERTAWMCKFPPLKQTISADHLGDKRTYNMLTTTSYNHQLQPVVQRRE